MAGTGSAVCPVTIGRSAELEWLRSALRAAVDGSASFVLLTGDAGIGKTRLAREAAVSAEELGMARLWGSCAVAELSLPYLPYLEAIGNQLAAVGASALTARLGAARPELAALFPQLDEDAPPPDPSDTGQSRLRLYEAILSILREVGAGHGLLLVIDDLQWADGATLELLDYQLRRLTSLPTVVLATCREQELARRHPLHRYLERWRRLSSTVGIDLGALDAAEVAGMMRTILDMPVVSPEVARALHDRSAGNPYAVEEMLKSSLNRGRLPDQFRLPRTVRDTLLMRLERLPSDVVDLLRCAAVLRGPFDYRVLASVLGRDEPEVHAALLTAVEEQLLEEDPVAEGSFGFRHPLTRDAVYEDMLAPQREALHLRAAEILAWSSATPPIDLCHHLLAARRGEAAVPLALEAAAAANRTHAYSEAARLYERVMALIEDPLTAAQVQCELGTALLLAGETGRAQTHLKTGIAQFERSGDSTISAHHRLSLGRCLWERGEVAQARKAYEKVRRDLEATGPSEDLALAHVRLAGLAVFELDGPEAVRLAEQAEALGTEAAADAPRIWAYNYHGLGLVQLNHVDDGLDYLDRSYREAAERGLNVIAANALYNSILVLVQHFRPREALPKLDALHSIQAGSMASLQALRAEGMIRLWGTGEPALARAAFEQALAVAQAGEAGHFVTWIKTQLAAADLMLDEPSRAAALLPPEGGRPEGQDRVIETWARIRLDLAVGRNDSAAARAEHVIAAEDWPRRVRAVLADLAAEALVAAGRLDGARRAVDWCTQAGAGPDHPYVLRMEGRLALAGGDPTAAAHLLSGAIGLWSASGVRHEEAWTRFALARAHAAAGDRTSVVAELRTALRSASERGAIFEKRCYSDYLSDPAWSAPLELVQAALEQLSRDKSKALVELRAASGFDISDTDLRAALNSAIEQAAQLGDPRDAEAGRVLREYYLRRVGSHEVVAARLHLSRTTFYRRLHRGWQLVAAELARRAR